MPVHNNNFAQSPADVVQQALVAGRCSPLRVLSISHSNFLSGFFYNPFFGNRKISVFKIRFHN